MDRMVSEAIDEIVNRCETAQLKYNDFASVHEAMGVALEEWQELISAVHANKIESVRWEALDLAAVLIRLATQCRSSESMKQRST